MWEGVGPAIKHIETECVRADKVIQFISLSVPKYEIWQGCLPLKRSQFMSPTWIPFFPPLVVPTAASGDPWGQCPVNRKCKDKFGNGSCDNECMEPECLRDGFDCLKDRGHCK